MYSGKYPGIFRTQFTYKENLSGILWKYNKYRLTLKYKVLLEFKKPRVMNDKSNVWNIISWIFGIIVFAIGIVNTFWGNDPGFGVFIILLSFVYFLPVNAILKKLTGFSIPKLDVVKIILGILILWASLGVGELFDKIELMKMDL